MEYPDIKIIDNSLVLLVQRCDLVAGVVKGKLFFFLIKLFSNKFALNQIQRSSWLLPIVNHGVDMDDEVLTGLLRLLVEFACIVR